MKKSAVILIGSLLFFAGLLTGNLIDNNQAQAVDDSIEYGYLALPHGSYKVEWNGTMVNVWASNPKKYPAKFFRTVKDGKVQLFGLGPR